jgi:hypothetical protein
VRTLERAEWKLALARETFAQAGVEDVVELVAGDAREALAGAGPIGFCFLDAAKSEHTDYYALAVPRLLPGACWSWTTSRAMRRRWRRLWRRPRRLRLVSSSRRRGSCSPPHVTRRSVRHSLARRISSPARPRANAVQEAP